MVNNFYGTDLGCIFKFTILIRKESTDAPLSASSVVQNSFPSTPSELLYVDDNNWFGIVYSAVTVNTTGSISIFLDSTSIGTLTTYSCDPLPYPIFPLGLEEQSPTYIPYRSRFFGLIKFNFTKTSSVLPSTTPYNCDLEFMDYEYAYLGCTLGNTSGLTTISSNINIPGVNPFNTAEVQTLKVDTFITSTNVVYTKELYLDNAQATSSFNVITHLTINNSAPLIILTNNYYPLDPEQYQTISGNETIRTIQSVFNYGVLDNYQQESYDLLYYKDTNFTHDKFSDTPVTIITSNNFSVSLINFQKGLTGILYKLSITNPNQPFILKYAFNEYKLPQIYNFPFAVISKNNNSMELEISIVDSGNSGDMEIDQYKNTTTGISDTIPPELLSFSFKRTPLKGYNIIVQVRASDDVSGVYQIHINQFIINSYDLTNGTLQDGTFEKLIDYTYSDSLGELTFTLIDVAGNLKKYLNYVNLTPIGLLPSVVPNNLESRLQHKITSFDFYLYEMNLETGPVSNILYINFSNADMNSIVRLTIYDGIQREPFIGYWSEILQRYVIPFSLPAYAYTEYVDFKIEYPSLEFYSYQLEYYNFTNKRLKLVSSDADRAPPIVSFVNSSNSYIISGLDTIIYWNFLIRDSRSGFKSANVSVKSTVFFQVFNLTFVGTGELEYNMNVTITIPTLCNTQSYFINYMEIADMNGMVSFYEYNHVALNPLKVPVISPLYKELSPVPVLTVNCSYSVDTTPPSIYDINNTNILINVLSPTRTFVTTFSISDNATDISKVQVPYCYLSALHFEILTVKAEMISNSPLKNATYQCLFNIPFGFGYPGPNLLISIHGYSDMHGNMGGISYDKIDQNIDINSSTFSSPVIETVTFKKNFQTGKVTFFIYGHKLQNGNVGVQHDSNLLDPFIQFDSNVMLQTEPLQVNGTVIIKVSVGVLESNFISINLDGSSDPTSDPPQPSIPCENSCGGPSNGECTVNGCVCKTPWIGNDCQSQIIKVQPIINQENPTVNNNYTYEISDGEYVQLTALISVLSLNQVKPNGEIVQSHSFNEWLFKNTTNSTIQEYTYTTNITNLNIITNVSVIVQYYKDNTIIKFGDRELNILPSTIKYKIQLTPYRFNSEINHLQLLMSSSIESSNLEFSCTSQENGITIDNADYIKLQVDSHSLYGKFIKYGLVDGRMILISNTIKNSEDSKNTFKSTSQIVAINIPFYGLAVILDPDFSLLVDTKPASKKENSICSESNSSKGLTKTQLAGIIVGASCFAVILLFGVFFYLYRHNIQFKVRVKKIITLKSMN